MAWSMPTNPEIPGEDVLCVGLEIERLAYLLGRPEQGFEGSKRQVPARELWLAAVSDF
jgi:hypothetical protein